MSSPLPFDATGVDDRLARHTRIEGDCHVWTRSRNDSGYGLINIRGRMWRVHRVAYMLHHGEDIGDLFVLHRCDNRPCFRVEHLFLGTAADNAADCAAKGRVRNGNSDREICRRGHAFDEANTRIGRDGKRACVTCLRERRREYMSEWRAANREQQREWWRNYRLRQRQEASA